MKSCAFIGYQPTEFFFKYNEFHPLCKKIKAALLEQSKALYKRGVRRFYVGGALGTDMWAGEAVLSLKDQQEFPGIELVCVIPFEGYNRGWDDEHNTRLERLLSACDDKQAADPSGKSNSDTKRYRVMVDLSEIIVAVCRGGHDTRSDAGQAVKYAKKRDKEIIFIHPETAEITCSDQN